MNTLQLVLLLLGASVVVVAVFRALGLPPILGYLLVGAVTGPHALGLLPADEGARELAEFGVVFLMFTIGLEFSLARLFAMKRIVFGLGMAQIVATMAVTTAIAVSFGLSWLAGMALGGLLAMSSTAILSKLLAERLELDSAHGREVMGVLLFQDLAVVPLLIVIPALSESVNELARELALAGLKATVVLG
ncbi:MAG TPA: cation:proton antiporter, partial [Rhodocyclaceae bacterium]